MDLRLQSLQVAVSGGSEGRLVIGPEGLVAVLVLLTEAHGQSEGCWFLEAGFGAVDSPTHPVFNDLEEAKAWIAARLAARPTRSQGE